jgi:hypothetical protein
MRAKYFLDDPFDLHRRRAIAEFFTWAKPALSMVRFGADVPGRARRQGGESRLPESAPGQKRRFDRRPVTSGLPQ